MFTSVLWIGFVTVALWVLPLTTCTGPQASNCTYNFTFLGLTDAVLTPEIGTSISIDFSLEATTPHCDLLDNVRITVGKRSSRFLAPLCIINYDMKETCLPPIAEKICKCLPEKGWYRLSKTIKETDYASWVWQTNKNEVEDVIVNITNPPRACLDPALSDNYLRPSISPEVRTGTDDARNVTPFYGNSVLHPAVQLHNTASGFPLPCKVRTSTSKRATPSSGYIEMSRPAGKRSSDNNQEEREYVNI
ncbi:hypothetical protein BaRGS_00035013 [Batillaria attramentaria]|uniref:Uncharacterized protein n=1 Tax=Batillaria attramentaria TaxID=370345 RepID=A0ABD0JFM1_9CAEN